MIFVLGLAALCQAHETDQFSVPVGRQFADLRFWMSQYMYDRLASALDTTNEKIRRTLRDGGPTAATAKAQSPEEIAWTVLLQFPPVINYIEVLESQLRSRQLQNQFPGLVVYYQPATWIYHHPMLLLDPTKLTRLKRTSTIMVNGTYFGTDKMAHFIHMGYLYFRTYRQGLANRRPEAQALADAVELGSGSNLLSENNILGSLSTGVFSNADLVADYAGMKLYRNLTEPVMLKGQVRPPLWARDGEFFRFNDHVRRDNDFFSVFISDHWNETLLPNTYGLGIGRWIKDAVRGRCPEIVAFYHDANGNPRGRDEFQHIAQDLSTYYGEEYGFQGNLDDMVSVANVCFDGHANPVQVADDGRGPTPGRDSLRRSALWQAARAGRCAEVESLARMNPINEPDIDGERPLHAAVRSGEACAARAILRAGADANAANRDGITPLHLAVQKDSREIVEILLANGAQVESRDAFGCSPMHDAARRASPTVVTLLLRAGANADAADNFGTTPLHRAARSGRTDIIGLLLSAGANPQVANRAGKTPLDEVMSTRNKEAQEILYRANDGLLQRQVIKTGNRVPKIASPNQP